MGLSSAVVWGKNVADAIKAIGVDDSAPVTDTQLELVWAAIKAQSITELGKADVAAGTFKDGVSSQVTGVGGPVT